MFAKASLQLAALVLCLAMVVRARAADTATIDTPASVPAGAQISVAWTGPGRQWDRIGIVPVGAPNESPQTPLSTYASGHPVSIAAPEVPGERGVLAEEGLQGNGAVDELD